MKIAICQPPIIWEQVSENLSRFNTILENIFIKEDCAPDLIVFPEFFTYGFSMNKEIGEEIDGHTSNWMREKSKKYNVALTGTIPILEEGKLFNRALFVTPNGSEYYYDKRHLFSFGGEVNVFTPGTKNTIVKYKGWNILLQICYDLRFPVWSRNRELSYDVVINMANWPSLRENVVNHLVRARAIENLSYYVFVNRSGYDKQSSYNKIGFISDYKGIEFEPYVISEEFHYKIFEINRENLITYREKFSAWKDADNFIITE